MAVKSKKPSRFKKILKDKFPLVLILSFISIVIFIVLFNRIILKIKAGEVGVIFRPFSGGTMTENVFPEGLHILNPFNTMTIYNLRIQVIKHDFSVLTNRGLPVSLSIAIRYKPISEHLGLLHKKIGPDYPNKIILTQIESVMRKGLGKSSPEDIYTNKDELLSKLITEAIKEISYNHIFVEDVIIRSVNLPDEVRKSIENKLIQEQKFLSYSFILKTEEQEAERKRIESEGIKVFSENISKAVDRNVLEWNGIQATLKLAESKNAKVIVIGSGESGLPLIMNTGNSPKPEDALPDIVDSEKLKSDESVGNVPGSEKKTMPSTNPHVF